jgi:selenophosphate synthetase-related protein
VALSGATVAAVATAGPVDRLVDSTAWSVPGARVLVHEVDGRAMGVEVSLIDGVVSLQRADGGAWTATYTPDVID